MEAALTDSSQLLADGAALMLVGMGTVFVFLTVLVFATRLMSYVVMRLAGDLPADGPSAEEVVAITAALELHRSSG